MARLTPKQYLQTRVPLENAQVMELANREEKRAISLLLCDRAALEDAVAISGITYKHFLYDENAEFFVLFSLYYGKYGSLMTRDALRTMVEEKHSPTEAARFLNIYNTYISAKVSPEDWPKLKEGLVNRFAQQQFHEACCKGNSFLELFQATSDQRRKIGEFVDKLQSMELETVGEATTKITSLGDSISEVIKKLEVRRDVKPKDREIICGLTDIDERFYGFRRGKYGVILGFPNGGKTSMLINFAFNMVKSGYRVCYITIESDDEEVSERVLALSSQVSGHKMKRGGRDDAGLSDLDMSRLYHLRDEINRDYGDRFTFITAPYAMEVSKMLAIVERRRRFTPFDVLIVDYLDVVGREVFNDGRPDLDLADVSLKLQAYGKQKGVLVWTAQSMHNVAIREFRKQEFLKDPEGSLLSPGVEDVGGSQKIARDADYILAVVPHPVTKDRLFIWVAKSRYDCPAGTRFVVDWDPDTCTITDHKDFYVPASKVQDTLAKYRGEAEKAPVAGAVPPVPETAPITTVPQAVAAVPATSEAKQ